MKVSLSDEALQDLIEATDWLIDVQAWAAVESLHTEVQQATLRLSRSPGPCRGRKRLVFCRYIASLTRWSIA